ncbi:MAG: right-handed parallel beta-helix repeat-containing protein, partial [Planctomycetota bacterium]
MDASPTIRGNVIRRNELELIDIDSGGSGIYLENSSAVVDGNLIEKNKVSGIVSQNWLLGAGIYCLGIGSPVISNNIIRNNSLRNSMYGLGCFGAGLCSDYDVSPTIINNVIEGNSSLLPEGNMAAQGYGGGVSLFGDGYTQFANNLICKNSITIEQNTGGCGALGGGVCCMCDYLLFTNNVIYDNSVNAPYNTGFAVGGGIFANP